MAYIQMNKLRLSGNSCFTLARCLIWCLAILSSCSEENSKQVQLPQTGTLLVTTDTLPDSFSRCYLRGALTANNDTHLILDDFETETSVTYSVNRRSIIDTINIPSASIRKRIYTSSLLPYMEWLNSDSLAFADMYVPENSPEYFNIYSIRTDSIVLKTPIFRDSAYGLQKRSFALYAYSGPFMGMDNKLIGPVVNLEYEGDNFHDQNVLGEINYRNKTNKLFDVVFPEEEYPGDYVFLKEYYCTYTDSLAVLSTSLSNDIVSYNMFTGTVTTKRVKSRHYKPVKPSAVNSENGNLDMDLVEHLAITSFHYINIYYDPYRQVYYRGYFKPLDAKIGKGKYATRADKITGMMVLDKAFNVLAEFDLEKFVRLSFEYYTAVSPMGLHILYAPNDSTFILKRYEYSH